MVLRSLQPGLLGLQQSFAALGTADSAAYVARPRADRVDLLVRATEAGTVQLVYVDPEENQYTIANPVAVGANELYPFQIDVLIVGVFKPFIRYVNTSNASGTVRFYANDNNDANQP